MAQVSKLAIKKQTGSDNTLLATWDFKATVTTTTTSSTGAVKSGSLVSIKSGATYYNGVSIPSWVKSDKWYVTEVYGDRAVLGKNPSGTHNIQSPINIKYLTISGGSSSGTSTTVSTNTLDHYTVSWYYATGDGIWFKGSSSDIKEKYSTYNPPSNAIKVKVTVKPVSKTHKVNKKDVSYWTGSNVSVEYYTAANPPEKPSTPTVKIDKYQLTASLENISDARTDEIQFEVYNGNKAFKSGISKVVTRRASYKCQINLGGEYRVRCRAINIYGQTKIYGEWSDYSSSAETVPSAPSKIVTCKATSETSVYLKWSEVKIAKSYELEYTTKKEYFDGSDKVSSITNIEFNHYEKTGLESGVQYFFRVRAVNDQGNSTWSEPISIIIGRKPAAPTTWSSSTTVISGESLYLYWVHNSEDGSSQTYAELELYIDGVKSTQTIKNSEDEDEKDKTSSYEIKTSSYKEGTKIQWRVRTAGITKTYGDWSIQRTVDIYAPPTLDLKMTDINENNISILTSFPFYIKALAGPKTQVPIGYHLSVSANEGYEAADNVGNTKLINSGDEVYSKYFDTNDPLLVELSASHLDLENNISYTITCTVSMDSGLTSEESIEFTVSWVDVEHAIDAEISVDENDFTARIRPYCKNDDGELIDNILLSVYRREFDGEFTEIVKDIENYQNVTITDPHPALDYARYRIVAMTKDTGAISFYDPPGYPVNGKSIIIQWDEEWSNFNYSDDDVPEIPPWNGSLLKLPYNIDVSDSYKTDAELVNYIGRKYPVSYYGTQRDSTSTWNVDIEKDDEDTLYALRRLAIWDGDVYVIEPAGSGYCANVGVSFSQKHCELVIPVTISITRVEGGV